MFRSACQSPCNYVLCGVFIDLPKRQYPHITVSVTSFHGKNVAGWRAPHSTPPTILAGVDRHVNSAIREFFSTAMRQRRSDSEPRGRLNDFSEVKARIFEARCDRPQSWSGWTSTF
jgi:hypothetical protein